MAKSGRTAVVVIGVAGLLLLGLLSVASGPAGAAVGWYGTPAMTAARTGHASAVLADGRVLVAGGLTPGTNTVLASAEIYDPVANTWTATAAMSTPRAWFTLTRLNDGRVLAVGGWNGRGYLNTAEAYTPSTGQWAAVAAMPNSPQGTPGTRAHHAAVLMPDGSVLIVGGGDTPNSSEYPDGSRSLFLTGDSGEATVLRYFPNSRVQWVNASGANSFFYFPLEGGTLNVLKDGTVLAVGGYEIGFNNTPVTYQSRELSQQYFPSTGEWHDAGTLNTPRDGHVSALLGDGRLIVAGGEFDNAAGTLSYLTSAEVFSEANLTWTNVAAMGTARLYPSAALLGDGTFLVASGLNSAGTVNSAEIWSPASGAWSATAAMVNRRARSTAHLLANGQVLVDGGASNASAELYGTLPVTTTAPTVTTAPPVGTTAPHPTVPGTTPTTVPVAAGCIPHPSLSVSPQLGPPGTVVSVSGHGFCPGGVVVSWAPGIGSAAATAATDGSFTVSLLVFSHDRIGPRSIQAMQGTTPATSPFLVVPGSVQPGDFVQRRGG